MEYLVNNKVLKPDLVHVRIYHHPHHLIVNIEFFDLIKYHSLENNFLFFNKISILL